MNTTVVSFIHRLKQISLDFTLNAGVDQEQFTKRLLECLGILESLMKISSASLQCTSLHMTEAVLSRFHTKTIGKRDVSLYYPNAEIIYRNEWTPYHHWELIDDVKDLHLQLAGVLKKAGLNFELYLQDYSACIFENIEGLKLYNGDELVPIHLEKQGNQYWFTPKDEFEASFLPFDVEIWYTNGQIQLELFLNWDVFAIQGTSSNTALQAQLLKLIQSGWTLDPECDLSLPIDDIPYKNKVGRNLLNSSELTLEGFIESAPIVEMI